MLTHEPGWMAGDKVDRGPMPPGAMTGPLPLAAPTAKVCVTGVAAAKVALPVCAAVIEHVPGATRVTVVPATVQTARVVEAKLTVSPELAVATIASGGAPKITSDRDPKVIVCGAEPAGAFTVNTVSAEPTPPGLTTPTLSSPALAI